MKPFRWHVPGVAAVAVLMHCATNGLDPFFGCD
jgi:hypothetical protein